MLDNTTPHFRGYNPDHYQFPRNSGLRDWQFASNEAKLGRGIGSAILLALIIVGIVAIVVGALS